MPREVFLAPGGSPFVQSIASQKALTDNPSDADTSLPELPSRYFRAGNNSENLNSSCALAGLDDISIGMADDNSLMRFPPSESHEMLMGVNGDEFLADDSAMGFDTSVMSKAPKQRSKLGHSTTVPIPVAEEAEPQVEIEQPAKVEKPKKKSIRSRSKSPSKKKSTAEPVLDAVSNDGPFIHARIETTIENPEPESETIFAEPVPKPRRTSPRKARTRPTDSTEAPPAFSATPSTVSPFASSSAPPTEQHITLPEIVSKDVESQPEVEPEMVHTTKPKRISRLAGRSKSKSRSKKAPAQEIIEQEQDSTAGYTSSLPVLSDQNDAPSAEQTKLSPLAVTAVVKPVISDKETMSTPAPEDSLPAATDKPLSFSKSTDLERPPIHTLVDSGSAPFKFQTRPSSTKSRTKSLTPAIVPTPAPGLVELSSPAPPSSSIHETEETRTGEPTKEEEAEAVAAAMRILRRDSLVFPRPRQSLSPDYTHEPEPQPFPQENLLATIEETKPEPVQNQPTHKRTRVGRRSTRTRGDGGATTTSSQARMNEVVEEEEAGVQQESAQGVDRTEDSGVQQDMPSDEVSEKDLQQDVVVPVNFGSRTPSPAPATNDSLHPAGDHQSPVHATITSDAEGNIDVKTITSPVARTPTEASNSSPPSFMASKGSDIVATKSRIARASMPSQAARASAPMARAARRSEGRATTSKGIIGAGIKKLQEPTLVEETQEEIDVKQHQPQAEVTSEALVSVFTHTNATEDLPEPIATAVPEKMLEPAPSPAIVTEDGLEPELKPELPEDVPAKLPIAKATERQKALGTSTKKVPHRPTSSATQRSTSGTSQRTTSSTAPKPTSRTLSNQKIISGTNRSTAPGTTSTIPPTASPPERGSSPAVGSDFASAVSTQPQRTVSSQKPASKPTRNAVPKERANDQMSSKEAKAGPSRAAARNKPTVSKARATRSLPKRAVRVSKEQKPSEKESDEVATVPEGAEIGEGVGEVNDSEETPEHISPEPAPTSFSTDHAIEPNSDLPDTTEVVAIAELHTASPTRPNKRRASSPEFDLKAQAPESPNKRVRFNAVLEAGPTPSVGIAQHQPRSSMKPIAKPKFELKASRPKRTLTRNRPLDGANPSYAAPLKRTTSERVDTEAATSEKQRPPLSESQANTRTATDKFKPTIPVAFTFRSELRMKPLVEAPLPAAIPIATPMPDFTAAHAAAEAANLARRERAQAAFLEAQAQLESWRKSKHEIGSETARRAAERAVFDAAMRVKEAEAERLRVEARKLEEQREAAEIKELRKRMVPKANPVPEWYKHIGQGEDEVKESIEI